MAYGLKACSCHPLIEVFTLWSAFKALMKIIYSYNIAKMMLHNRKEYSPSSSLVFYKIT